MASFEFLHSLKLISRKIWVEEKSWNCVPYSVENDKIISVARNYFKLFAFSVVLLNKTDLVNKDEINQIKSAIKILNPEAEIATTQYSKVDLNTVVNTNM